MVRTGRSSKGSASSLSPKVTLKMVAILSMSLGLLLQWFSIERMSGYSLVTKANSLIASTTSYGRCELCGKVTEDEGGYKEALTYINEVNVCNQ